MKKMLVLLVVALISTSSFAQQISNATANATYSTFEKLFCKSGGGSWDELECLFSSTTAGGVSITISAFALGAVVALKEDIQNVEIDSLDFIAGEPMTHALANVIEKVRQAGPEFNALSDQEIVAILLNII